MVVHSSVKQEIGDLLMSEAHRRDRRAESAVSAAMACEWHGTAELMRIAARIICCGDVDEREKSKGCGDS